MVTWRIVFTSHARRDAVTVAAAGMRHKAEELLELLAMDPFRSPPPFEKLVAGLTGAYSRRINVHNRLVYQVVEDEHVVKVLRMWTHYE